MKSLKKYWFFPAIPALFALWLVLNELSIYARIGYFLYSFSTSTFNWITFIFFAAALAALALNAANAKKPAYVLFGVCVRGSGCHDHIGAQYDQLWVQVYSAAGHSPSD